MTDSTHKVEHNKSIIRNDALEREERRQEMHQRGKNSSSASGIKRKSVLGMKHTGSLMSSFLTVTISLPFYCVDSRRLYYICNWKLMKNEPLTHFFFFNQFIFSESKRLKSSKRKDNEWAILFITTQKKTLTIMSILIL